MNLVSPSMSRVLSYLRFGPGVQGLLVCLFLWVPLVAGALDLAFGGSHDFARRWLISAAIADTVCLLCYGGALLLQHLVTVVVERRGRGEGKERGLAFYFAFSALLMPCLLPVGLLVGSHVAGLLHRPYRPDLGSYRVGLGFGAVMLALFFLYRARGEARDRVRDLENANLKAQLAVLTAEMNPHMLFNALNTIASLVHGDPDRAEETVLELAEVYRGVLRASGAATHSLADELRLCEAYLRVESARYGDRLTVAFSVDDAIDPKTIDVPVLLLQPLVENAVRHGIAPRARGGRVSVRVLSQEHGFGVLVDDDGVGFGKSEITGNGRALANCKERLRLAYGDGARLDVAAREEGGTRAHVSLPAVVPA
jgi:two-component sensor histidine kinase